MWVAMLTGCVGQQNAAEDTANRDEVVNQPANTSCILDSQCAGDLVCRPMNDALSDTNGFDRRCQPPGEAGSWCGVDSECASGYVCQNTVHQLGVLIVVGACMAGTAPTCVRLNLQCANDLICRPTSRGGGFTNVDDRCVPIGQVGDFCGFDGDCAPDLYCSGAMSIYGSLITAGVCSSRQ
jgi:hypothetical protein